MKVVKISFGVKDRLILESVLPTEGTYLNLKLYQDLKSALELSAEEREQINLRQNGPGTLIWDEEAACRCTKDVNILEATFGLVKQHFIDIDRKGKIRPELMWLYEKFVMENVVYTDI